MEHWCLRRKAGRQAWCPLPNAGCYLVGSAPPPHAVSFPDCVDFFSPAPHFWFLSGPLFLYVTLFKLIPVTCCSTPGKFPLLQPSLQRGNVAVFIFLKYVIAFYHRTKEFLLTSNILHCPSLVYIHFQWWIQIHIGTQDTAVFQNTASQYQPKFTINTDIDPCHYKAIFILFFS